MGILESIIVTLLTKKVCDHITEPRPKKPSFGERYAVASLRTAPDVLLKRINTRVLELYQSISVEDFEKAHTNKVKARCVAEFRALSPEDQSAIKRFYNRIGNYPAWRVRLELIQFLLTIEDYGHGSVQHLLHNELLYMINNFSPSGEKQVMFQKVCCFLDAEFFFLQGDFVSALKRLYDTINWEKMLCNPWLLDRANGNGLEDLLGAALSNIINIYALIGLPDKAEDTRRVFGAFFRQNAELERDLDKTADERGSWGSHESYRLAVKKAPLTSREFVGFYTLRSASFFDNMFDEFVLCVVGDKVFYSIGPAICYEFEYDNKSNQQKLWIKSYGVIENYVQKIEHAKATISEKLYFESDR